MSTYQHKTLRNIPEQMVPAAQWVHSKWRVPTVAYLECTEAYLQKETEYGLYRHRKSCRRNRVVRGFVYENLL